jgi:hypothetical protein
MELGAATVLYNRMPGYYDPLAQGKARQQPIRIIAH